ncbi:hypothetical protein [Haloglycomyces albus]|uniref:hypothetical protein n=1 Tax=Haloglycomyces albus TaxID=526067 RepID=UPI00046D39B3|nr:hypothetical protein [Haloglycomyces albus]
MNRDILEKVLYDLSTNRANLKLFSTEPDRFLKRYRLSEDERQAILGYEVRTLANEGVNTMLTWGYWLQSGRSNDDYLAAMRQ